MIESLKALPVVFHSVPEVTNLRHSSDVHIQLPMKDYRLIRNLSSSSRGTIHIAKITSNANTHCEEFCVLKKFEVSIEASDFSFREFNEFVEVEIFGDVAKEINILKSLSHKNIISYLDSFGEYSESLGASLYLAMEFAQCGPLMNKINEINNDASEESMPHFGCSFFNNNTILESFASKCLQEILSAVNHMHKLQIVHRDIKVDNILLTLNGDVKVCDFGTSLMLPHGVSEVSDTVGTFLYWSPEMCYDREQEELSTQNAEREADDGLSSSDCFSYNPMKADVWAIGVTLYICLYGKPPYYSDISTDLFDMIALQGEFKHMSDFTLFRTNEDSSNPITCYNQQPLRLSPELTEVMRQLLCRDPNQRISSEDCLNMPWISNRSSQFHSAESKTNEGNMKSNFNSTAVKILSNRVETHSRRWLHRARQSVQARSRQRLSTYELLIQPTVLASQRESSRGPVRSSISVSDISNREYQNTSIDREYQNIPLDTSTLRRRRTTTCCEASRSCLMWCVRRSGERLSLGAPSTPPSEA